MRKGEKLPIAHSSERSIQGSYTTLLQSATSEETSCGEAARSMLSKMCCCCSQQRNSVDITSTNKQVKDKESQPKKEIVLTTASHKLRMMDLKEDATKTRYSGNDFDVIELDDNTKTDANIAVGGKKKSRPSKKFKFQFGSTRRVRESVINKCSEF